MDFKNTGEVLEFYKNTPPQDLKALTGFVQTFGIDKIIYQLESNKNTIVKYTRFFPEINELLQLLATRNDYITKNKYIIYDVIYGGSVPAELKEINNNIRTVNKKLREKVKALLDTINKLKKQGLIEPARLNIKKDSWRFKAAGELAGELAPLWFVSKVTLVGSVAKGTSTAQSDIDLLVDVVLRKVSAYLDRLVGKKINLLEEKYRPYIKKQRHKIFHCVMGSKQFFKKMGFFEASYPLAEENYFKFSLDRESYSFEKFCYLGYYARRVGHVITQLIFYPGNESENYTGVWVIDDTPAAVLEVSIKQDADQCGIYSLVKDVSQAVLAKYQLTENFPIMCETDTRAAVEKMFKGKQVFSRNFQAVC